MSWKQKMDDLIHKFKGKMKTESFLVQLPEGMDREDLEKFIPKVVLEEMEDMRVANAKLHAKLEEINQQEGKAARAEENAVKMDILNHHLKQKKDENLRTLAMAFLKKDKKTGEWVLPDYSQLPTFYLKNEKAFFRLAGMWLYENTEGYSVWYPMLMTPAKRRIKFQAAAPSFDKFFRRNIGFVSQLLGGKIDSNFALDATGKTMYLPPDEFAVAGHPDERIRIIDISEQDRLQYEQRMNEYRNGINQMGAQVESMRKERDAVARELAKHKVERNTAEQRAETMSAQYHNMSSQLAEQVQIVADATGAMSGAALRQRNAEISSMVLMNSLNEVQGKLNAKLGKEDREIAKADIVDTLHLLAGIKERVAKGQISKEDLLGLFRPQAPAAAEPK